MKKIPETTQATAFTTAESETLLNLARQSVVAATLHWRNWRPDLGDLPPRLSEPGASFVTLHTHGKLHGCIGSIEARLPLALDVVKNAENATLNDPRFPPLQPEEVDDTEIEISILTPMQPLSYTDQDDLIRQIRPGEDGVLVERGWQRGLLLPQVWEHIPNPREFLAHVALKAYADASIYADTRTTVYKFQIVSFTQPAPRPPQPL